MTSVPSIDNGFPGVSIYRSISPIEPNQKTPIRYRLAEFQGLTCSINHKRTFCPNQTKPNSNNTQLDSSDIGVSFSCSPLKCLNIPIISFSPFFLRNELDLCYSEWVNTWIKGTTKLCIYGLPSNLSVNSLKIAIEKVLLEMDSSYPIELKSFYIVFGNHKMALNPGLNVFGFSNKYSHAIAIAEFYNENQAKFFYYLACSESLKLYGAILGCICDPSGFRILGEAVVAKMNPIFLKISNKCNCCLNNDEQFSQELINLENNPKQPPISIFLPFVTNSFYNDVLQSIPILKYLNVTLSWHDELYGASLRFPSREMLKYFCIQDEFQFKILDSPQILISTSFFTLGKKGTPCILELYPNINWSNVDIWTTHSLNEIYQDHTNKNSNVSVYSSHNTIPKKDVHHVSPINSTPSKKIGQPSKSPLTKSSNSCKMIQTQQSCESIQTSCIKSNLNQSSFLKKQLTENNFISKTYVIAIS